MPESPRVDGADLVTARVLVNGRAIADEIQLLSFDVEHAINRIPNATVTVADGSAADENFPISAAATFEPGNEIELEVGYHAKNKSVFKGIIVKHSIRIDPDGSSQVRLTCHDKALRTTMSRQSAVFRDMTDSEAIAKVLSQAGLDAEVEATSTRHAQLVLNRATGWGFVLARAEANGRVVTVAGGKVSVKAPRFDAARLEVEFGDTIDELDIEIDAASQWEGFATRAWDPTKQAVAGGSALEPMVNKQGDWSGKKLADVLGLGTVELTSPAPLEDQALAAWADAALLKSRLSRVRGRVSFPGSAKITPGELLDLAGLGKHFNGAGYVSAVRHRVVSGTWRTEAVLGLSADWVTETDRHVTAPAAAGLVPGVSGLQIAIVEQVHDDPAGEHRVLVKQPLSNDQGPGLWARMASPHASKNAGIVFLPEVGDEVIVGFVAEDPAHPVVLGALWSGARPPPETADADNRLKAIVSGSQLKVTFDDTDEVLTISTPGGHTVTLSDKDKIVTVVDANGNALEMAEGGVTLASPGDIAVNAKGAVSIKGEAGVTIGSPADVRVDGANVALDGKQAVTAKGGLSAELSASGQTKVQGAMVLIN